MVTGVFPFLILRSCFHHVPPQKRPSLSKSLRHGPFTYSYNYKLQLQSSLLGMGTLLSAREEDSIPVLHSRASLLQFFLRCWPFSSQRRMYTTYTRLSDQTGPTILSLVPALLTVSLQDSRKPDPRLVVMFSYNFLILLIHDLDTCLLITDN